MRKTCFVLIILYLLCMFFIYTGFFRDYSDPLEVTKYYFECIKNREGFLTYQLTTPDFFYPDIRGQRRQFYGLDTVLKFEFKLLDLSSQSAHVQASLFYPNDNVKIVTATLVKKENNWFVSALQ